MIYLTPNEQAAISDLASITRQNILRAHVDWNLEYANCPDHNNRYHYIATSVNRLW